MSLPTNYRQVAMMGNQPPPGQPHVYMPASPMMSNILKDRLARTPGTPSNKAPAEPTVPSPFTPPTHGNPSFAPQKLGTGKGAVSAVSSGDAGRIPKPPKAPDKPLMPYMRYSRKVWDQVKAANTELKLWEIGKIIGSMWRDLPEADKQDFVDEYESEKADYTKALEVYHASPAYQQYLAAKAKGASAAAEEKEAAPSAIAVGTKLDRRIDIQPAEDDEDYDDGLTVKHVAHSRYVRNHRLVNDIFSDTMVPDVRSVVTSQRLTVLRRQVQSLTMHQKKLETELQQIEEKFEAKKRKFVEAGDSFQTELKKVKATAPKLDVGSFETLVERQREVLRREAEDRQRAAQGLPPLAQDKENHEASTGPQPQNTATLVDATPSPIPPQQDNDASTEDDMKAGALKPGATTTTVTTVTSAPPAVPRGLGVGPAAAAAITSSSPASAPPSVHAVNGLVGGPPHPGVLPHPGMPLTTIPTALPSTAMLRPLGLPANATPPGMST